MKKLFNKGFTMVELIIVIAIIAVLAAVLAPQYLRFVEDSKKASDLSMATHIVDLSIVAVAAADTPIPAGTILEIMWTTGYDESHEHFGVLLVREAYNSSTATGRKSTLLTPTSGYVQKGFNPAEYQEILLGLLMVEGEKVSWGTDQMGYLGGAQSSAGKSSSFVFHLDTSTGKVASAHTPAYGHDGVKNIWIDEIGVDIERYPY